MLTEVAGSTLAGLVSAASERALVTSASDSHLQESRSVADSSTHGPEPDMAPVTSMPTLTNPEPLSARVELSGSELQRVNVHVLKAYCREHMPKRLDGIERLWAQHGSKLWRALEKKRPGSTDAHLAQLEQLKDKLMKRKAKKQGVAREQ